MVSRDYEIREFWIYAVDDVHVEILLRELSGVYVRVCADGSPVVDQGALQWCCLSMFSM